MYGVCLPLASSDDSCKFLKSRLEVIPAHPDRCINSGQLQSHDCTDDCHDNDMTGLDHGHKL